MLVIRIEEWPGGNQGQVNPIARLDVANLSGLAPVSDYEVLLRRGIGPGPILARGIVRGHRRDDGWLPLARTVLRAVDPNGGFYSSPHTQVPADVLAVLPLAPYTSRACQTGRAVLAAGPELDGLLAARGLEREAWADEFFKSCRETEKWTGLDCQDPRHGNGDAAESHTWTVAATGTAPTSADAERRARGIGDMIRTEFGDSMKPTITVAPASVTEPAPPTSSRPFEGAEIGITEGGLFAWRCNGGQGCEGWVGLGLSSEEVAWFEFRDHASREHAPAGGTGAATGEEQR